MASVSVNQFYTTSEVLPEGSLSHETSSDPILEGLSKSDILLFFDVNGTVSWIQSHSLKRIALQFPDQFVPYSNYISRTLEEKSGAKTFILADTSYRSCCVDEVAAAHASCDGIIHYGDACLSNPAKEKIKIRYVLGHISVDDELIYSNVAEHIKGSQGTYILVANSPFDHCLQELSSRLKKEQKDINLLTVRNVVPDEDGDVTEDFVKSLGRKIPKSALELEECTVIFIGSSSSPLLTLWLLTYPQCTSVIIYDPVLKTIETQVPQSLRQLRKRLFLVEKLKDANTVGLVVGSVNVGGHKEAVERVRNLCKVAGKKVYVISVGKINVPKLSNFTSDIDVFILLSCPFGVMLDCSDYFRPVLSLFEAEVALNSNSSWFAGKGWTADFSQFLKNDIGERDPDEADVSLLTGTIRNTGIVPDATTGEVALYSAGEYFKQRTWKGLDDSVRVNESTEMSIGRTGIAASYQNEPEK